MKRLTHIFGALILIIIMYTSIIPYHIYASSKAKAIFTSALVYRGDGQGDYAFEGNGKLDGTTLTKQGVIEYVKSPGIYEFTKAYVTEDTIAGITANWKFTGKVTMEVSTTGYKSDYAQVVNGVPLEEGKFKAGNKIIWRATLDEGGSLTEVKIVYMDSSGVLGDFGTPELSGFTYRKPIYISGDNLFHCQLPIKVGESSKSEDCDVYVSGAVQSDFLDSRFTLADQETLIPHWLEAVTGSAPNRTATFWLNIPQIPKKGMFIYLYYGKANAEDLSDAKTVFDFFDDFKTKPFDTAKWEAFDFTQGILEYKVKEDKEVKEYVIASLATEGGGPKQSHKKEIIDFFKKGPADGDFEWVRFRKPLLDTTGVNRVKTKDSEEEMPNLPEFKDTRIAINGDLILEEKKKEGTYISPLVNSPFKVRVMVPSWTDVVPSSVIARRPKADEAISKGGVSIDISATTDGVFAEDCENQKYYYVSKKAFNEGDKLRWRTRLYASPSLRGSPKGTREAIPRLKRFCLDFRQGAISVISPNGKELVAAGSRYPIVWDGSDYEPSYMMSVAYSADGGKNYSPVVEAAKNTGRYAWFVPDIITDKAMVKVADALNEKIYDISNAYFSIGKGPGFEVESKKERVESREKEEEAEEIPGTKEKRPGTNLYELLIKVYDKGSKDAATAATRGFYEEGDIVMIKPAGFLWGAEEKTKFLIIQTYLTENEAKELMMPKEVVSVDKDGHSIKKIAQKRKYKLDIKKQGLLDQKTAALKGLLKSKPIVKREAVEEKK